MRRGVGMASLVAATLMAALPALADPMADIVGRWRDSDGESEIAISRCGPALCGKIVWLKQPIDTTTGQPQKDDKNRDLSLRARPIVGVQLFIDMRPSATNSWSGRIYNADDGHTYASTVTLLDAGRLEVKGCSGTLCGGETWTKVAR